jgi:formamidopyrimidine-DNA glycosylase
VPELPDLTVYLEHLDRRTRGAELIAIRLASPFVLRTVAPTIAQVCGRRVLGWRRLAKQLVLSLDGDFYVVIHLMISGRLRWERVGTPVPKRNGLAAFDFDTGTVVLTEASKKRRASLKLVEGAAGLAALDPGGIDVLDVPLKAFASRLKTVHHTVKRALTDQHIFAGIGNAYSDEILLRARMSPFKQGSALTDEEAKRLYDACREILAEWTARLREQTGEDFPTKVTAFHGEMAVHGKFRQPCPVCGAPVQRIVYAENESNYCAKCQTAGRLLADRSLSRLLKATWPKRLEDLE